MLLDADVHKADEITKGVLHNERFTYCAAPLYVRPATVVHEYTKQQPFLTRDANNFWPQAAFIASIIHLWKMFHVKQSFKTYDSSRI